MAQNHRVAENQNRIYNGDLTAGLYLDRAPSQIPDGGMVSCNNVRIESGKVRNDFLGWTELEDVTGPSGFATDDILLIVEHISSDSVRQLIIGTTDHLFVWDGTEFLFLTPDYSTGLVDTSSDENIVLSTGSGWTANVSVGDWIHIGDANYRQLGVTPDSNWFKVATVPTDTSLTITGTFPGTIINQPYTILKTFSGTTSDIWSGDMFRDAPSNEDLWIATNGTEIVKWDGSADEVTVLSLGFTCKIIRYFKNTMWYGNLVYGGNTFPGSIRTSALTDPENVSTLESTEIKVSDESPLLALEHLSDAMACYAEKSVNVVHSVDAPVYWNTTTALPDIGIICARAIVNFGNFHEFLAADRAYRFDGVSEIEIGKHVLREVLKNIDPNRQEKAIGYIDTAKGEVLWVIPLTTDGVGAGEAPVTAYTEHYDEAIGNHPTPYTKRDLPAVSIGSFVDASANLFSDLGDGFDTYTTTFANLGSATPLLLFGDDGGNVMTLNSKNKKKGIGIISTARFARRPVMDGDRVGRIVRIEPVAEEIGTATDYTMDVSVYTSEYEGGSSSQAAAASFDLSNSTRRHVSIGKPGRHVEIEFGTDATATPKDRPFAISGFSIVSSPLGRR